MDLLPIGFLVLIVLMSGGIAVLADDLGRRLGKKRLHIKGIRPKRVAQIGTFLAGLVVSLGTILVVSIASSDVRRWILEGNHAGALRDAAIRDRDRALQDRDERQRELAKMEIQRNALQRTNNTLGELNRKVKLDVASKQDQLTELHQQIGQLEPEISQLRQSISQYQARIQGLNVAKTTAEQTLKEIDIQLKRVQGQLTVARESARKAVATTAAAVRKSRKPTRQTRIC